jgi:hypothetical protein
MATSVRSPGEVALGTYLETRRLPCRYESAVSGPNPDFEVDHPICGTVVMDVHEPEYRLPPSHSGPFQGPEKALRRAIESSRKKRQAKSAVDRGCPFVVVLARTRSDLEFGSHQVVSAMFGSLQIRFPVGGGDPSESSGTLTFGLGGRLQPEINTRFSTIAVLTGFTPGAAEVERTIERESEPGMSVSERLLAIWATEAAQARLGNFREGETTHRLAIFHNPFAKVPLCPQFAGPHDDQWMHDGDHSYQEATWGVRGSEVPGRVPLELPSV